MTQRKKWYIEKASLLCGSLFPSISAPSALTTLVILNFVFHLLDIISLSKFWTTFRFSLSILHSLWVGQCLAGKNCGKVEFSLICFSSQDLGSLHYGCLGCSLIHLLNFLYFILGFPGGSEGEASAHNAGDPSSIPGSGRSPGEGNGNPLQYSCLGNSMDGGTWWATVHGVTKHLVFTLNPAQFTSWPMPCREEQWRKLNFPRYVFLLRIFDHYIMAALVALWSIYLTFCILSRFYSCLQWGWLVCYKILYHSWK